MPVTEVLLSPLVLGLLGLCVGSFLNVVIHRLPRMLERGWRMESADLLGVQRRAIAGGIVLRMTLR
jgi:leader peptidase (prepilin peptidase)/N-methyltransferase